jgi:hypothetical protein
MDRTRFLIAIFAALPLLGISLPMADAATTSTMYLTGYSVYDNDPPGSKDIAYPRPDVPGNHLYAGGSGSFSNPVTLAVGLVNGVPQFKPGTKLYIPIIQKYVRVEDSCADCGKGYNGHKWIDVWVNGETSTSASADACMNKITGLHKVVVNPPNGYKLAYYGDLARNDSCTKLYTETVVLGPKT